MTNWLCITTSDNWKITKNENVLGFKERVKRQIFPIKNGDIGFIYLKTGSPDVKNPRVIAKFEFVSEIYKDDAPLFSPPKNYPRETFPLRCKIKILAVLEEPINFRGLVPNLSFIRCKETWGVRLMGHALIDLSNRDFDVINSGFK